MVVRAIAKVSGQMKREFTQHTFKPFGAIQYDSRLFSFKAVDEVSLWCIGGRQRIKMIMTGYQKKTAYESRKQANLVFIDNQFYLLVVIDTEEKQPLITNKIIGVDFGIVKIATLNDGTSFDGAIVESVRKKYAKLRASLQRKGTKSAKRRLKKISSKESRLKRDLNHQISKKIVTKAKGTNSNISIENLKGIRRGTTVRKSQRAKHHSWSFFQLREFIEYKAKLAGITVFVIDPRYTSQQCRKCGNISKKNRKSQSIFRCNGCGFTDNADINASFNIASRAVSFGSKVNQPIVASA
jgi:IS605 OrfB family transposase